MRIVCTTGMEIVKKIKKRSTLMGGCIDGTKLMLIFQTGQNKTTFFFFSVVENAGKGKRREF